MHSKLLSIALLLAICSLSHALPTETEEFSVNPNQSILELLARAETDAGVTADRYQCGPDRGHCSKSGTYGHCCSEYVSPR